MVKAVEDADTLLVVIDDVPERIQLQGIDAPEDVENPKLQRDLQRTGLDREELLAIGKAATDHLKTLITPGQEILLVGDLKARDRYGRISVDVQDGSGHSLSVTMVQDGYATVLTRLPLPPGFRERLLEHEMLARHEDRGLWGSHGVVVSAWSGK